MISNCLKYIRLERSILSIKAWAALFTTIGCFMNGGAIAYTGPALPNLMNDGTKDLYGNDLSVSFQSASWIGE